VKIVVIYGDTDSTYPSGIPPKNERLMEFVGEWVSDKLDSVCKKYNVKENLFVFRVEKSYDQFFLQRQKKKYSGHKVREYKETISGSVWKRVDKFEMVGHEKSDISIFGNEMFEKLQQQICLSAIHDFDLWSWIAKFVKYCRKEIKKRPVFEICPTNKASRPFDTYGKMKGGKLTGVHYYVHGAKHSNKHLGTSYVPGMKIPTLYVKHPDTHVIALPEDWDKDELKDAGYEIDYSTIFKKQIIKKFREPVEVLGYKMENIVKGRRPVSVDAL
jgi:DNA polymerase elongation subunit (family B)